jgi:hypothetical protein
LLSLKTFPGLEAPCHWVISLPPHGYTPISCITMKRDASGTQDSFFNPRLYWGSSATAEL